VEDDGPGIPPGDLPHVFEPLFTLDRAAGRQVGSGLGLAIVAELVSAMGGSVTAHSPAGPDGGTRTVVALRPWVGSGPAGSDAETPAAAADAGTPATSVPAAGPPTGA
jgi:signal transduction histidine kinase